jgi:hypothetical protein
MGLSNDTGGSGAFISIVNGKWALGVPEGTEGATERENKNGKKVWELTYSKLSAKFTTMDFKKVSFGTVAEFPMVDSGGDRFKVSFSIRDQHLMTLCKVLPNINLDEEVDLTLALDKEKSQKKGKSCYGLLIKQGDNWLKHHWKRENLPEAEETRDGLNFTKQEDFLLDELEKAFAGRNEQAPESPQAVEEGVEPPF